METDEIWRLLILTGMGLGALVWAVGGFVSPVAGRWRDGAQDIVLQQLGPLLWGEAHFAGGWQSYRGCVWCGRVQLRRADHGEAHLRGLGFDEVTWPQVDGRVTGHLRLRLRPEALVGTFTGRRFVVHEGKVSAVHAVASVPRSWSRG